MDSTRRTRPARLGAAALLATLALAGCGDDSTAQEPPPPPAPAPQLAGVQLHPLWDGVSPREAARELDVAKRAGADVVRIDIGWGSLELAGKGRISPDYSLRLNAFLNNARARRMKVIATLHETPCWASRAPASLRQGCRGAWWTRGVARFPPRRARDYGDAAVYIARRFGDRLLALEIWNEPNMQAFLRTDDPVGDYGRLVRASYKRVKRVKPRLTVLAGSLLRADGDFLIGLYEKGRIGGHYDAISYHPYTPDPNAAEHPNGAAFSLIAGTTWLHDIMVAHGDKQGLLWATEAGASTCATHPECVDEREQALRIGSYVRVARRFPYVRAMVIYNLRDKGTNRDDIEQGYGLVRRDLSPKPALRSFKRVAAE